MATQEIAALAKRSESFAFFAEGTFTREPGLRAFRMGAFVTAASAGTPVNADLFLLTNRPLRTQSGVAVVSSASDGATVDGAPGFSVAGAEPINASLHQDLAGDRNMSWVPDSGYVTYLTLNAPGSGVTYDLGIDRNNVIRLASFGTQIANLAGANPVVPAAPDPASLLVPALLIAATMLVVLPVSVTAWRRARVAAALRG